MIGENATNSRRETREECIALMLSEAAYMRGENNPVIRAAGDLLELIGVTLENPPTLTYAYDYESTAVAALNLARAHRAQRAEL